jgi:lysozyme family protein
MWCIGMSFERAMPVVAANEGGYSDHPSDRGGATNFGITQRSYDLWRSSRDLPQRTVKDIEQAEVASFYLEEWVDCRAGGMLWPINLLHFDASVNHGPRRAAVLLQSALGVTADGVVGPVTLAAANEPDPTLPYRLLLKRVEFYNAIAEGSQLTFLRGWLSRIKRLSDAL